MEDVKNNLGDYLFLNGDGGLYEERCKQYDERLPKVYGDAGKLIYVDFPNPILLDQNYEVITINGVIVHNINGKMFVVKKNDRDGFYLMDNSGNISTKHYDNLVVCTNALVILSNNYYKNSKIDHVYTIVTEDGILWVSSNLPDQLFSESGYYILRDKINTSKFKGLTLDVLYDNHNNPIKASINDDLLEYYESIKDKVIPKERKIDSRFVIEEFTKRELINLGFGTHNDSLVDMIIDANSKNTLLVVSLNTGRVLTFKGPEMEELEKANKEHLRLLRRYK